MIITFCGHSSYKSSKEDEERLLNLFEEVILDEQVEFYLGNYGDFDIFALKCAIRYKENHTSSKIKFITPYLDKWLNKNKEALEKLYDEIIYPNLEHVPPRFAILKRNEWMIDQSDYVFAYVKTHYGGAYKTLLYARRRKKPYHNLFQGDYELY